MFREEHRYATHDVHSHLLAQVSWRVSLLSPHCKVTMSTIGGVFKFAPSGTMPDVGSISRVYYRAYCGLIQSGPGCLRGHPSYISTCVLGHLYLELESHGCICGSTHIYIYMYIYIYGQKPGPAVGGCAREQPLAQLTRFFRQPRSTASSTKRWQRVN